MGGFKRKSNNIDFKQNLFSLIILHISKCCEIMRKDYEITDKKLDNDEDIITNHLVHEYLNEASSRLLFIPQMPVHYDTKTYKYKGRVDIAVNSRDQFSVNSEAYYIIE